MSQKLVRVQILLTVQHDDGHEEVHSLFDEKRVSYDSDFGYAVSRPLVPVYKPKEVDPSGFLQIGPKIITVTLKDRSMEQKVHPAGG